MINKDTLKNWEIDLEIVRNPENQSRKSTSKGRTASFFKECLTTITGI